MNELPQTELSNPRTANLDELSTVDLVRVLTIEQREASECVSAASEELARAVDEIASRLSTGGRLHYVGAGTSGRIGFLDASEMPPTFGTDPSLVCAHIAGGTRALTYAVEGAEDDEQAARREMFEHVHVDDAVVGLSASGSAAYVIAALEAANDLGAYTFAVTNCPGTPLERVARSTIVLQTGSEPLTGSTRLKAGTAQKILLNTLSTAVMVRLEKVYGNLMVDVVATNAKLRKRALRLVGDIAGVDERKAAELLLSSEGSVKLAVVMARNNLDSAAAAALLHQNKGSLRRSLR